MDKNVQVFCDEYWILVDYILVGIRSLFYYLTTVNTYCTVTQNNDNLVLLRKLNLHYVCHII